MKPFLISAIQPPPPNHSFLCLAQWDPMHVSVTAIIRRGSFILGLSYSPGFNPSVGKIPWRRERLPTSVFWPGEFRGLYSAWSHKESDTTERLSLPLHFKLLNLCVCILCISFYLYLFFTVLGLCGCSQAFSGCGERGCSRAVCSGFSLPWLLWLRPVGSRAQAQ